MKTILFYALTLLLLLLVSPLEAIYAQTGAIILIDRTGSMLTIRPITGNTRCEDARTTATVDINSFFATYPTGVAAVWTFADNGYFNVTGGFTNKTAALAALEGLSAEGCSGLTPLAEAMCSAADALRDAFPEGQRRLYVSSDGGENNSDGECFGFDGVAPPWPDGSWQRKVLDKFEESPAIVSVRYWGAVSKSASEYDYETGLPSATTSDDEFFRDLAYTTGGTYTYYDDGEEPPPPVPAPSLSTWGLLILIALLLSSGLYVAYRRRPRTIQ